MSKKRRKNGSFISGFCSCTVPRVAMFTTAGVARFSIGASDGTGVSPATAGNCALASGTQAASAANAMDGQNPMLPAKRSTTV